MVNLMIDEVLNIGLKAAMQGRILKLQICRTVALHCLLLRLLSRAKGDTGITGVEMAILADASLLSESLAS